MIKRIENLTDDIIVTVLVIVTVIFDQKDTLHDSTVIYTVLHSAIL